MCASSSFAQIPATLGNQPLTSKVTLNLHDYYVPEIAGLNGRESNQFMRPNIVGRRREVAALLWCAPSATSSSSAPSRTFATGNRAPS